MGWYCPECAEFNERDDYLKCPCGRKVSEALLPSLVDPQEELNPDRQKRTLEFSIILLLYCLIFAAWIAMSTSWGFLGLMAGFVLLAVGVGAGIFYFKRQSGSEK